jgi:hypothetical protein
MLLSYRTSLADEIDALADEIDAATVGQATVPGGMIESQLLTKH